MAKYLAMQKSSHQSVKWVLALQYHQLQSQTQEPDAFQVRNFSDFRKATGGHMHIERHPQGVRSRVSQPQNDGRWWGLSCAL